MKDVELKFLKSIYDVTNGSVIITGSFALKCLGIIDRKINDIDLKIHINDWNEYKLVIFTNYKIKFLTSFYHNGFKSDVYNIEFNGYNFEINTVNEVGYAHKNIDGYIFKIDTAANILSNKRTMVGSYGINIKKHLEDIELIESFLNVDNSNIILNKSSKLI